MRKALPFLLTLFLAAVSCATSVPPPVAVRSSAQVAVEAPVHLVIVGTTDLHGWFAGRDDSATGPRAGYGGLAVLSGYIANLRDLKDVHDVASCDTTQEAWKFLNALPPGTIDAYFAGHTHQQMREIINGVPAVQAMPFSQAFSTIDLYVDRAAHRVVDLQSVLRPHTNICENVYAGTDRCDPKAASGGAALVPRTFEGARVVRDARLDALFAPYLAQVDAKRKEPLGVRTAETFGRQYSRESALGNLYTDALRAAVPGADVAFVNSGSLRIDLPAKDLTYGDIFEISPFDNLIAVVKLTGAQIREMVRITSAGDRGILQVSGLRMTIDAAKDAALPASQRDRVVSIQTTGGSPLQPEKLYTVVMTDFLLTGGEGLGSVMKEVPADRITVLADRGTMREVFIDGLHKLATNGVLTPGVEGRITVINDDKQRD